ncbi:MAG: four helix bundle protein [Solirubrobacterales bacterium]
MAGGRNFRSLLVYQRATALADDVREATLGWTSFDRWTLGVQLVRSADSIGANIAEAFGRHHGADQRRLLHIARGSTYETEHWIERALARGLLSEPAFRTRASEIGRMLNGLIRTRAARY